MSKFIFFTAAAAAAVFLSACAQNKAKFSGRIDDEPAPVTSTAKVGGDAGETKRVAPTFPSQPKATSQAASGDPAPSRFAALEAARVFRLQQVRHFD